MEGTLCNRCSGRISKVWRTTNGKNYHLECHTCAICDSVIGSSSTQVQHTLQEIYCRECYAMYFQNISMSTMSNYNSIDGDMEEIVGDGIMQQQEFSPIKKDESTEEFNMYTTPINSFHAIDSLKITSLLSAKAVKSNEDHIQQAEPKKSSHKIKDVNEISEEIQSISKKTSSPKETKSDKEVPSTSPHPKPLHRSSSRIPVYKNSNKRIPSAVEESKDNRSSQAIPGKTNAAPRMATGALIKPMSSVVHEYLNSKGNRTPTVSARNALPLKGTHSVAVSASSRASSSKSKHSLHSQRSSSCGSSDAVKYNVDPPRSSKANNTTPIRKRTKSRKRETNLPKSMQKPISSDGLQRSNSSTLPKVTIGLSSSTKTTSFSQAQMKLGAIMGHAKVPVWNNITFSPDVLPNNEQLLSVMLQPGEEVWRNGALMLSPRVKKPISNISMLSEISTIKCQGVLDCPICFESLIDNVGEKTNRCSDNVVTDCGHIFHRDCINNWLEQNGNSRCPICLKVCDTNALISVYLDANTDFKSNENEGLAATLSTMRYEYKVLQDKYNALLEQHKECGVKCAISDSLRSAYEVECRNRLEMQWENKRLQRQMDELHAKMKVSQAVTITSKQSQQQ